MAENYLHNTFWGGRKKKNKEDVGEERSTFYDKLTT